MRNTPSVVLAGGGTAGHVNPLLAVADGLVARESDIRVTAVGTAEGIESDLVPGRGYELRLIPRVPLPRRPSPALLSLPARFRGAVSEAAAILTDVEADVVVGFGGYVATPVYFAARRLGVPIVIHEQNARPGVANRLGARWATAVATTFDKTPLPHAQTIGLPLSADISRLARARAEGTDGPTRLAAAEKWHIDVVEPTLLVTGGSLGAQQINEGIVDALADLVRGAQVIHLTGRGKDELPLRAREELPTELRARYMVVDYTTSIHELFALADLVVCRAGAGTVCELSALGLPAVYVPLPIGNGEQERNIRRVIDTGAAITVKDQNFSGAWVRDQVVPLLADSARLGEMSARSREAGHVGATDTMVDIVLSAAASRGSAT